MKARRTPQRVSTAIRFDPDVAASLAHVAERHGLSMNWLVNRCVRATIGALDARFEQAPGAAPTEVEQ